MGTVTYPDIRVVGFINENMIPLQVRFDDKPLAEVFNVKWTPTIITLDASGKEHYRTVGFLAPDEFLSTLHLGIAKAFFDTDMFEDALRKLETLIQAYPSSDDVPEAIYLRGVSLYKTTHDPKKLREVYEKLKNDYPGSGWSKRAFPYRLL